MRFLALACLLPLAAGGTTELTLTSPADFQVVQRQSRSEGRMKITGRRREAAGTQLEVRLLDSQGNGAWHPVPAEGEDDFSGTITAPAGGWYRCEARLTKDGRTVAETAVPHVGVGEVFLVAGQSNSANHGEEKQSVQSGRVASFDGRTWHVAHDPQRGASGSGGSFMPPLGDALTTKFGVPVGFIPIGIGATSVREWLPTGVSFPEPPTILSRVTRRADGSWESKGAAYDQLIAREKQFGPQGFRAVLWHQGESDANQKDPARTLPGALYQEHLGRIIRDSRREAGWEAPWFVAQVSYHVPGDEASAEIRDAQAALWKNGLALPGPDSDALKGALRERGGKGVHFSGPGLRAHAARWAERITPWLEEQLARK
jgi:hypothetical protein